MREESCRQEMLQGVVLQPWVLEVFSVGVFLTYITQGSWMVWRDPGGSDRSSHPPGAKGDLLGGRHFNISGVLLVEFPSLPRLLLKGGGDSIGSFQPPDQCTAEGELCASANSF